MEELGAAYETVLVDRSTRGQKTASFLALNPNGLIPVLETPQGPMFETGAILIWLADTHQGLLPAVHAPARQNAIQWMLWLANTLHPTLRMMFYPDQYADGDPGPTHRMARIRLEAHLDILAKATTANWLDDNIPSANSCYLAPMLRWAALYGGGVDWFELAHWPRLLAFAQRYETREAAMIAAKAEALGHTPFSAPTPCKPSQGSAV